jgi:hypothetical protein
MKRDTDFASSSTPSGRRSSREDDAREAGADRVDEDEVAREEERVLVVGDRERRRAAA